MEETLICVPIDRAAARELAQGQTLAGPLRGYAPNQELAKTFELPLGSEELDFAAQQIAGVAGLIAYGERLVLIVQSPSYRTNADEAENGGVLLGEVQPRFLKAYFSEASDAESIRLVRAAAAACNGATLEEAWAATPVQELLQATDLLWSDASELSALV